MENISFELPINVKNTNELMVILDHNLIISKIDWKIFWLKISSRFSITTIISKYSEYMDWNILSSNPNIKWDHNLLNKYESNLNWDLLSCNPGLDLNERLIDNYLTKWKWKGRYSHYRFSTSYYPESLSFNPSLPLSIELIERYLEHWDWVALGLNKGLIIDTYSPYDDPENYDIYDRNIDIIIHFKNKWSYHRSPWEDDNIIASGYGLDSIFNNPSINWERDELRMAFKDEIEIYNKQYDENI